MKTYNTILFDLDGTLTDPGLGITNSVMYALKKYGIEVSDRCFEKNIKSKKDIREKYKNLGGW